jgi:hypothetical protein
MGFDGGAVGSDAEAAQLSPADPKISTRLSNGKNRKLLIARLLFGRVLMGENMLLSGPNSRQDFSLMAARNEIVCEVSIINQI